MTASDTVTASNARAAWAGLASAVVGLAAFILLVAFLVTRLFLEGTESQCIPLIRAHDVGVILQSLLMLPVVAALGRLSAQGTPPASTAVARLGLGALALVAACAALIFTRRVPDDLYMIPQGLLAAWLVLENRRLSGMLGRGLARLGLVAAAGLALVAVFPLGFTAFVDPAHLQGWTPFDYRAPPGTDAANIVLHLLLLLGTFTGVALLPIWTWRASRRLR